MASRICLSNYVEKKPRHKSTTPRDVIFICGVTFILFFTSLWGVSSVISSPPEGGSWTFLRDLPVFGFSRGCYFFFFLKGVFLEMGFGGGDFFFFFFTFFPPFSFRTLHPSVFSMPPGLWSFWWEIRWSPEGPWEQTASLSLPSCGLSLFYLGFDSFMSFMDWRSLGRSLLILFPFLFSYMLIHLMLFPTCLCFSRFLFLLCTLGYCSCLICLAICLLVGSLYLLFFVFFFFFCLFCVGLSSGILFSQISYHCSLLSPYYMPSNIC